MRRLPPLLAALALAAAAACSDSSSGPEPVDLDGRWSGQATLGTFSTFTLTITEADGQVTASGNITQGSASAALTGVGTWAEPSLSLTLSSPGYEPIDFTATYDETSAGEAQLRGRLNGSGFGNTPLTLTRE